MLGLPNISHTKRLPGWVMLHVGMRVRLTTTVLQPWAVQDSVGTVVEINLSGQDRQRLASSGDSHLDAEMLLRELPKAVYVKLDNTTTTSINTTTLTTMFMTGSFPAHTQTQ